VPFTLNDGLSPGFGDVPDHVESGMKDGSLQMAENGCVKRPLSGKGAAREDQNRNDPWSARAA
jgi:hypothetical protein